MNGSRGCIFHSFTHLFNYYILSSVLKALSCCKEDIKRNYIASCPTSLCGWVGMMWHILNVTSSKVEVINDRSISKTRTEWSHWLSMFRKPENGFWRTRMFKMELQTVCVAMIKSHLYFHKMVSKSLLCTYNFVFPWGVYNRKC